MYLEYCSTAHTVALGRGRRTLLLTMDEMVTARTYAGKGTSHTMGDGRS